MQRRRWGNFDERQSSEKAVKLGQVMSYGDHTLNMQQLKVTTNKRVAQNKKCSSKLKARQIFESQVQIYANLLSQPERRKIR